MCSAFVVAIRPTEVENNRQYDTIRQIVNMINEQLRMKSYVEYLVTCGVETYRVYCLTIPHINLHCFPSETLQEIEQVFRKSGWKSLHLSCQGPVEISLEAMKPPVTSQGEPVYPSMIDNYFTVPVIALVALADT